MVYAYIRVSSDKQTVENQRYEIERYANNNNIFIDKHIEETISGVKDYGKRKLGKLINKLKNGDILITSEISRLGRSLYMIMDILNVCLSKGCKVITIKDNFRLGDNIESKVLAFAFGLSAEIERKLISQRTKEAMNRIKNEGVILGRPKGSKNKIYQLDKYKDFIIKCISEKKTKAYISRRCHVNENTLRSYIKRNLNII